MKEYYSSMINAVKAFMYCFEQGWRGTGRTTRSLDAVKDGDIYVVHTSAYSRIIQREFRERKVDAKVIVADSIYELRENLYGRGRDFNRVHIDHQAEFMMLQNAIINLELELNGVLNEVGRYKESQFAGDWVINKRD